MVYGNAHRAFVQAFFAHRVLTYEQAEPVLKAILEANSPNNPPQPTPALFQHYLSEANTALLPYDFEIRQVPSQLPPRTTHYILTNTTSDALIQLATSHSADEIAFLRRVLDVIFDTGNTRQQEVYGIRSTEALRLHKNLPGDVAAAGGGGGTTGPGLSMREAEQALHKFCEEGWLEKSPERGNYIPSLRGLAELKQYLIDTYNPPREESTPESPNPNGGGSNGNGNNNKIRFCYGCKDIVTIGMRCANLDCGVRFHETCQEGYFRTQNRTGTCPLCGVGWTADCFVGERAETGRVRRGVQVAGGAGRRVTASQAVGGGSSVARQLKAGAGGKRGGRGATVGVGSQRMQRREEEEEEEDAEGEEEDGDEDGVGRGRHDEEDEEDSD